MSVWRRKAIELFPDLKKEFQCHDTTVATVFFALLPRCQKAHLEGNHEELEKIYGYAEWCFRQKPKAKHIWNDVCVAFYEHLGEYKEIWKEMHNWVKPDIFEEVAGLLEWRMEKKDFAELKRQYARKKRSIQQAAEPGAAPDCPKPN